MPSSALQSIHKQTTRMRPILPEDYVLRFGSVRGAKLTWQSWSDVCELLGKEAFEHFEARQVRIGDLETEGIVMINKATAKVVAEHGDWILADTEGNVYMAKPGAEIAMAWKIDRASLK